jgi:predicted transcriptional regulator
MAMTLRLDPELDAALTARAARDGRSKQEVASEAIRVYVEHLSKREALDLVLDSELPRYADALDRLGR